MTALPALVTVTALADRLQVAEPGADSPVGKAWAAALLDASNEIRRVIGQPITAGTATIEIDIDRHGRACIPLCPVRSLSAVTTSDDRLLEDDQWQLRGQRFWLCSWGYYCGGPLTATIEYGFPEIPGDIQKYVCVLAAAQIASSARGNLGMTGGVTSVAVDDGKVVLTDAPAVLPELVQEQLRAQYGGSC